MAPKLSGLSIDSDKAMPATPPVKKPQDLKKKIPKEANKAEVINAKKSSKIECCLYKS